MKVDTFAEMFLLNRNFDRLIRVLQRLETFSIAPREKRKAYEVRLEEIRAGLNADFAEVSARLERADESRLRTQRTAWEARKAGGEKSHEPQ